MANLPKFLQKPSSYGSRLFDVTKHCLGCLCSFDMPPTSYTEYMLDMWQCIMFMGRVGLLGEIPFFLEFFHISTRAIHSSLLVDFTEEVFGTKCSKKGLKKIFFQHVSLLANCSLHHLKATIFNHSIICVNVELCLFKWKNIYKKYNMQ